MLGSGFLRISEFPKRLKHGASGLSLNVLETCNDSVLQSVLFPNYGSASNYSVLCASLILKAQ